MLPQTWDDGVAAFSPDGKRVVVAVGDNLMIRDATTEVRCCGQRCAAACHCIARSGLSCAVPKARRVARGWCAADSERVPQVCLMEGHTEETLAAAFSPDGQSVVSGSKDRTVKIWNAETGQEVRCCLVLIPV